MAGRRKGRILTFQALYSRDVNNVPLEELLEFSWVEPEKLERFGNDCLTFARLLIAGTVEHLEEIDALIKKHVHNWDFSRLNKVDLAVLRMSVYSLLYQKDIPVSIIIDEAIDITKEYGSGDSFKFVNGVLDAIRKADNGAAAVQ